MRSSNLQVGHTVSFSQGDLEHLQVGDEGSQSGQTLLAAAAHADQQRVPPPRLKDSVYTTATSEAKTVRGEEGKREESVEGLDVVRRRRKQAV